MLSVHGGGPSSIASFDLPVPGGSFAEDLARRDINVYMMDIRGWGRSEDPETSDWRVQTANFFIFKTQVNFILPATITTTPIPIDHEV